MTQKELGSRCAITFPQVQKYESGVNRIGFSRLVQIANSLDISIRALIDGIETAPSNSELVSLRLLRTPMALQMLTAFSLIKDPAGRKSVLAMAQAWQAKNVSSKKKKIGRRK